VDVITWASVECYFFYVTSMWAESYLNSDSPTLKSDRIGFM